MLHFKIKDPKIKRRWVKCPEAMEQGQEAKDSEQAGVWEEAKESPVGPDQGSSIVTVIQMFLPLLVYIMKGDVNFSFRQGNNKNGFPYTAQDLFGSAPQKGLLQGSLSMGSHDDCIAV